jgi:chromosome segregation ATPase
MNEKSDVCLQDHNDNGGKVELLMSNINSILKWVESVERRFFKNDKDGIESIGNISVHDEISALREGIEYFLIEQKKIQNYNESTISLLSVVNKETVLAHAQVEQLRSLADRTDLAERQLQEKAQEALNLELQLSEQKENADRVADEAKVLQDQLEGQIDASESALRKKDDAIALMQAELEDQQSIADRLTAEAETLRTELKEQSGFTENRLRQKEEEIVQAQAALDRQLAIVDSLASEAAQLREKLDEANKWVFKLAGQRRDLELAIKGHQNRSAQTVNLVASSQSKIFHLEGRLLQEKLDLDNQKNEVKRLQILCEDLKNSINVEDMKSEKKIDPVEEYKKTLHLRNANDKFGIERNEKMKLANLASDLSRNVEILTRRLIEIDAEAGRYRNLYGQMKRDISCLSESLRLDKPVGKEFSPDSKDLKWIVSKIEKENNLREKRKDGHENLVVIFSVIMKDRPKWWYLMPKKWRDEKNYQEMKRHGVFDRDLYYSIHPDVASSQMDALDHYIRHGVDEGRTCSA